MEERGLDRSVASGEERPQVLGGEARILGFRTEPEVGEAPRGVTHDGAEGPRVGERRAPAIREREEHAGVLGECVRGAAMHPVPVQAEVHEERGAVVEVEELVLAAAFDVDDPPADHETCCLRGERAPLRRVQHLEGEHDPPARRATEAAHGELDFGKLGHAGTINPSRIAGTARGHGSPAPVAGSARHGDAAPRVRGLL